MRRPARHWRTLANTACLTATLIACARPEQAAPARDTAASDTAADAAADTTAHTAADTTADSAADSAVTIGGAAPGDSRKPGSSTTPTTDRAAAAQFDTARGVVHRVGADPLSRLLLVSESSAGAAPLALAGAQQAELAAAEGLEVTVSGTRTSERAMDAAPGGAVVFQVRHFVVRAADGVEARDGVLREVGGRFFLETAAGGRIPVADLPAALRTQVGARVFLVGPLTRAPQAFGVLRRR